MFSVPPLVVMLVADMPLPAAPEALMVSVPPFWMKSAVFTAELYEASELITCIAPDGVSVTLPPSMVTVALLLMDFDITPLFFTVTVPPAIVRSASALMPTAL